MAESPKQLGAIVATAATTGADASGQLLYTVPGSTAAIVSTIFVCNQGGSSATFKIAHVQNGGVSSINKKYYTHNGAPISGNDTIAITTGIAMAANDSLVVYASSTDVNFVATGIEIT